MLDLLLLVGYAKTKLQLIRECQHLIEYQLRQAMIATKVLCILSFLADILADTAHLGDLSEKSFKIA